MERIGKILSRSGRSRRTGCRGCGTGCLLLLLLLAAFLCGLIYLLSPHSAQAMDPSQGSDRHPLAVWLLIDNSNSMYEKGGIGSDPTFLRLDAARLFLSYLGVDEPDLTHRAGVIFFGSTAETAVSLTPLTGDHQRTRLFAQLADPPRMGWTDHLAALNLAQAQMPEPDANSRPAIILLTDGKPEWHRDLSSDEREVYIAALRRKGSEFAAAGIPLFIILLANEATAADGDIAAVWQPLWQELSQATPPGRFFVAGVAAELPAIYHDIVVALTERQTAGVVWETAVSGNNETALEVAPNLEQVTLVISKSSPTQTISIIAPDGSVVTDNTPSVRHAGGEDAAAEEVWVIEQPTPGTWIIRLDGAGDVTIWQDYIPAPPPVLAPTASPTRAATPAQTLLAPSQPTPTPPPATVPVPISAVGQLLAPTATDAAPLHQVQSAAARPFGSRWLWLFVVPALFGVRVIITRRRSGVLIVTGSLRLLDGMRFADGRQFIDLDGLTRPLLIVGKPPADVPIAQAAGRAAIRPGTAVAGAHEMLISGSEDVLVDGKPLRLEMRLSDTAVIDFGGGVRARYENLMLRRAERERAYNKVNS